MTTSPITPPPAPPPAHSTAPPPPLSTAPPTGSPATTQTATSATTPTATSATTPTATSATTPTAPPTGPAGGGANAAAASRWSASLMRNFATPAVELVAGSGANVTDADGKTYLDLLGGIAVNALGHAHPAVVEAVSTQIATLGHVSNFFSHPTVLELAERLVDLAGGQPDTRVLFCNSGAEANEAAFKIARLTGKSRIIATNGGFHGRTMGALALTGQPAKQQPFAPMVPGVQFVDFGDVDALRTACAAGDVAAVFLEPIQGENGVVTPPDDYLAQARKITKDAGALLVLDEVQTGIGRTGTWFCYQHAGITPDVVTLAKGLGGGLPIGAVLAFGAAANLLTPGLHGSTFAGNPVSAAAALAVLRTITTDRLLDNVQTVGKHLADAINGLGDPAIDRVRGQGLLLGVVLRRQIAGAAVAAAQHQGFLINAPAPDVLRLAPPLILTTEQADAFVAALPRILRAAEQSASGGPAGHAESPVPAAHPPAMSTPADQPAASTPADQPAASTPADRSASSISTDQPAAAAAPATAEPSATATPNPTSPAEERE